MSNKDEDDTEIAIVGSRGHAVLMVDIQETTSKDPILQKVIEIMRNGNWE